MAVKARMQRMAVVAGLLGAASLTVVSTSGQALAQTQPAPAKHTVTTAQAAQTAAAAAPVQFYGPYSTYEECLAAQSAVVTQGGVVAWKCGFLSLTPTPQYGFYVFV